MVIDLKQCVEILKENDNFLILSHEHPDGDTLGSAFALASVLKKMGKKRAFKCSDEMSKDFSYMYEGFENDDVGENPFIVAVDVADVHLLGDLAEIYGDKVNLCIDHHMSNAYFSEKLLLQDRAAACEIVFKVIKKLGVEMPNVKMSIYKNRRGRWKNVLVWIDAKRGICRFDPLFVTKYDYELINMEDFKINVKKSVDLSAF